MTQTAKDRACSVWRFYSRSQSCGSIASASGFLHDYREQSRNFAVLHNFNCIRALDKTSICTWGLYVTLRACSVQQKFKTNSVHQRQQASWFDFVGARFTEIYIGDLSAGILAVRASSTAAADHLVAEVPSRRSAKSRQAVALGDSQIVVQLVDGNCGPDGSMGFGVARIRNVRTSKHSSVRPCVGENRTIKRENCHLVSCIA